MSLVSLEHWQQNMQAQAPKQSLFVHFPTTTQRTISKKRVPMIAQGTIMAVRLVEPLVYP